MHPTSRLLLCRCGFVLFCVLPTLIVGGWIVRRSLPEYRLAEKTEWERVLAQRLGVVVAIGELHYTSPNVACLNDVRFAHAETGETIASVREVEIASADGAWTVELRSPVVDVRQLAQVAGHLHDRLLGESSAGATTCLVQSFDVTLQDGQQALTLFQCAGVFEQLPDGDPQLSLEFALPESAVDAPPCQLSFVRNRQIRPPTTRWQIDTAGGALPCWLAVDALPQLRQLGPQARFEGAATWTLLAAGLQGQVSGRLHEVDLDTLVSEQFPHQLSGAATIALQRASIDGGRLTELQGTVQAHDGWVSPSLLAAAGEHLGMSPAVEIAADEQRAVPFRQLSVGFHLSDRALLLTGGCDPTRDGVALANAAGPLLEVPPRHATAAVNVLRALLPASDWQVPATRQTGSLAALLPVPDLAPELTARRLGHTPTRLLPPDSAPRTTNPVRQPR